MSPYSDASGGSSLARIATPHLSTTTRRASRSTNVTASTTYTVTGFHPVSNQVTQVTECGGGAEEQSALNFLSVVGPGTGAA